LTQPRQAAPAIGQQHPRLLQQQPRTARLAPPPRATAFEVSVRPYTLRKGDTLESIAKKRGESC
jgi:hypothetical protein